MHPYDIVLQKVSHRVRVYYASADHLGNRSVAFELCGVHTIEFGTA